MAKEKPKPKDTNTAFQKFERLARKIVNVPKDQVREREKERKRNGAD